MSHSYGCWLQRGFGVCPLLPALVGPGGRGHGGFSDNTIPRTEVINLKLHMRKRGGRGKEVEGGRMQTFNKIIKGFPSTSMTWISLRGPEHRGIVRQDSKS